LSSYERKPRFHTGGPIETVSDINQDEDIVALLSDPKKRMQRLKDMELKKRAVFDEQSLVANREARQRELETRTSVWCPIQDDCHVPASWVGENPPILDDPPWEFSKEFDLDYKEAIEKAGESLLLAKEHVWYEHGENHPLVKNLLIRHANKEAHKQLTFQVIRRARAFQEMKNELQARYQKLLRQEELVPSLKEARKQEEEKQNFTISSVSKYLLLKEDDE